MRKFQPSLLFLALFLIVPAISIYGHSAGWQRGVGLRTAVLLASTDSAEDLYRQGVDRFEDQRYRDALALFEAATAVEGDVDPRGLAFHREAARLRLAGLQGHDAALRSARLELLGLAEGEKDLWGARATRELARAGFASEADVQRHLQATFRYWEDHPDLDLAIRESLDLLTALLDGPGVQGNLPWLRMWQNLVAADAPRADLLELGARILTGQATGLRPSSRIHRAPRVIHHSGFQTDMLHRTVATDVLALEPERWLAAVSHLTLASVAESEEALGVAVQHLRAAIDAADPGETQWVRDAQQRLRRLTSPRVELHGPELYRPGSAHSLRVGWANLRAWELEIRRLDPIDDARPPDLRQGRRGLADFYPEEAGQRVRSQSREDEREQAVRASGEGSPHLPRHDDLRLEALPPGLYSARVQGRGFGDEAASARFVFQVTDLALAAQSLGHEGDRETTEFWLIDLDSGQALDGVPLVAHVGRRQGATYAWTSTDLRTDADGLTRLSYSRRDVDGSLVVGEWKDRPVVALDLRTWGPDRARGFDHVGLILTDRPLYRPNETVRLQAFLRQRDLAARENRVPDRRAVEVRVNAPDGTEFLRQEATLDDNGALELSMPLPESPSLGQYHVMLRFQDDPSWVASGRFQVDEVRLPEFTVSVSLDDTRRYVLGDSVRVDVDAEYLFGGAVSGAAEIVVRRQPVWIGIDPILRFGWLREDSKFRPHPWMGGGEEVLRVTRTLDADGRVRVVLPTERRDGDARHFAYTVEARVTDASRREETGLATVKVAQQELFASLSPRAHVVAPGRDAQLTLRIQDAMGRPVVHSGSWVVHRLQDDDARERVAAGEITTDANGMAEIAFRPDRAAHYAVDFTGVDGRGLEFTAQAPIWCADPRTTRILHAAGGLQLIVEKDEYLADDTARVLLVSDVAGLPVYLARATAEGIQTEVIHLKGTAQLLEVPLTAAHRPAFHLSAARGGDFQLHTAQATVVAPLAEQALTVDVEFAEESYRPGAEAELRIRARDALGRPVVSPVTVSVVDDAVLAVLPRDLPDPASLFHNYWTQRPAPLQLSAMRFGAYRELDDLAEQEDSRLRRDGDEFARAGASEANFGARQQKAMLMDAAVPAAEGAISAASPVAVRTDFRTTALWTTGVFTDADGTARVQVPLAESLTRWQALALAMTPDASTGQGVATTRTRKPLMVRLNHPRVFREQDRFWLGATVHNETDADLATRVEITAPELALEGRGRDVVVPAHGQVSLGWWASVPAGSAEVDVRREDGTLVVRPTEATVTVVARSATESDAFERRVRLHPHGTPLRVVASAEIRDRGALTLRLPSERLLSAEQALLTVSPSVLSACLDALPYLADYPYGCTEQTLSRFVPAVAVRHAVEALGVSTGRIDPDLDKKIAAGLRRIADLQQPDGSWGWWKQDPGNAYMTSLALTALSRAVASGVDVDRGMLERGREALRKLLPGVERNPDTLADALVSLVETDRALDRAPREDDTMRRFAQGLVDGRDNLRDYARARLALYLHRTGHAEEARLVLDHLDNTRVREDSTDTVHWGRRQGYWWRGEGAVETTAFALAAYGEIAPEHPHHAAAARWLVGNRRGARWDNTRDTAHAIYALVDFAVRTGELAADYQAVARLGGEEVARWTVTPESFLDAGGVFPLPSELLEDGTNRIEIELEGEGVCYATVSVDTWTAQEKPEPVESFLAVRRELVRLVPHRTLGGSILAREEPLVDGDAIHSGDRIRVRLTLTARNDLEYLAIEDPRPAGCEPVDQLSGWFWGGDVSGRREVREDRTAFFVSRLAQGTHILEYELRAESPGGYHVMPTRAYAMYVGDVFGSSGEDLLSVRE